MIFLSSWVLILLSLLLGDSIGSPTTSTKILPVLAMQLILPSFLLSLICTNKFKIRIYGPLRKALLYLALPVLTMLTVILSYLGSVTEVNQVFVWTRLHQSQLGIVILYLSGILLLDQPFKWWHKNLNKILLYLPYVVASLLFVAHSWPMNYFLEIVKEDRIIEYLQFFVLLAGSIGTGYFATISWLRGQRNWQVYLLMFLSFGLLVVSGDEISWGQRLFGLETPEAIAEVSRQGDITLHNLNYFEWMVGRAYLILALLGLFARPFLQKIFGKKSELAALAPTAIFIGYFIFPAFYHGYSLTTEFGVWREWSEPIELCLYAGLSFWVLYLAPKLVTQVKT